MDSNDKPNVIDVREFDGHPINRLARVDDETFLRYIKSLDISTLRRKLLGPKGKELGEKIDAVALRLAEARAKEATRGKP